MHAYEAANDHPCGGAAATHLAVEDQGVAGRHILHMAVEDVKDDLFGRLPISEGQPVVLHPVPLLLQLIIHLPGSLH